MIKLLNKFINENNINVNDLTSSMIYAAREFEEQAGHYVFGSFDETSYDLPKL